MLEVMNRTRQKHAHPRKWTQEVSWVLGRSIGLSEWTLAMLEFRKVVLNKVKFTAASLPQAKVTLAVASLPQ